MRNERRSISENRGYELAERFLKNLGQGYQLLPDDAPRDQLTAIYGPCNNDIPRSYGAVEIDYSDFFTYAVILPSERPRDGTVYLEVLVNKYSEHVHVHYAPYMKKRDNPRNA